MKPILFFFILFSTSWTASFSQFVLNYQRTSVDTGYVLYEWEVDSEINIESYVILRSGPGATPAKGIGMLHAIGHMPTPQAYSWNDWSATDPGEYCYSLRVYLNDFTEVELLPDTNTCETPVVSTTDPMSEFGITLYPNPAEGHFSIVSEVRGLEAEVWNAAGERVYRNNWNSMQSLVIQTTSWPAGLYVVRLSSKEGTVSRKLVIR